MPDDGLDLLSIERVVQDNPHRYVVSAAYLTANLLKECGIAAELTSATWSILDGLIVETTEGQRLRLRVSVEPAKEPVYA